MPSTVQSLSAGLLKINITRLNLLVNISYTAGKFFGFVFI
jgi:hypothetical protein